MYVQSYMQTPESCPELLQEPSSRSASGAGLLLKFGLGPPLKVDRMWGRWGSYCVLGSSIFYLLEGTLIKS